METFLENKEIKELAFRPRRKSFSPIEWMIMLIRIRARLRMIWLRLIWTENLRQQENESTGQQAEIEGYLKGLDQHRAEAAWLKSEPIVRPYKQEITHIEKILARDKQSRLSQLVSMFRLSIYEKNILYTCLAVAIESDLNRVFAYLQDHSGRNYVTIELVSRLFGQDLYQPIGAESPLKKWGIITETIVSASEPFRIEIDPAIRNWVLGKNDLPDSLTLNTSFKNVKESLSNWPLGETLNFITKIQNQKTPLTLRIFIAGAENSGRSSFAAALCSRLNMPLMVIDSNVIPENRWRSTFIQAQRHALLNNTAIAWTGTPIQTFPWPKNIAFFNLQFVIGEVDEYIGPADGVVDYRIEPDSLSLEERKRLWLQLVPASAGWPTKGFSDLIRRYSVSVGQIVEASNQAVQTIDEAIKVVRSSSRQRLGDLAQLMVSSFDWDDLIISQRVKENLTDFYYEASERNTLWEQPGPKRLFPQGKGLFALFTGPPGTGKTMAAQVIANSLGMDLFRIDLSTIVSKYVGETSKNIERILSRAQRMDVVLFFDEADALFGKRTEVKDAHDRFANTDTNYLLQAIEQYPGIAILASNKKENIDPGFSRRLRFIMDFPKPEFEERLELWRRIVIELTGSEIAGSMQDGIIKLAEGIELTGAQIKFAILSAVFIAQREKKELSLHHIFRGLEKEMMKDERPVPRQIREMFK